MAAFNIRVAVDLNGKFTYTADGIPDASSIRPRNGDTVSWSVTLAGMPIAFQVEFPGFSPFDQDVRMVRSLFLQTQPLTVNLPKYYHGNQVFKYTVTLANGWSDDPVVQPVPSDGLLGYAVNFINLSVDNQGNLVLDQPNANFAQGEVTWRWAAGFLPDDFTVTFTNPPWLPAQATSQNQILALNMQTVGGPVAYSVQTLHLGLSNNNATLQIH